MLTDGRTDDRQKVITIAHPEHSSGELKMLLYLLRVIWNILYPAINDANLVSDCFPEPPTPTNRALPRGVRIILDI